MSDTASVRGGRRTKSSAADTLRDDESDADNRSRRGTPPPPSDRVTRSRKDSVASSVLGAISGGPSRRKQRRDSNESVASDFSVVSAATVATVATAVELGGSKRTMGPPPPVPPSRRRGSVSSVANGSAPTSSHRRLPSTSSVSGRASKSTSSHKEKDKEKEKEKEKEFYIPEHEVKALGPMLDDDVNQITLRNRVVKTTPWYEEGEVGRRLNLFFFSYDYGPGGEDPDSDNDVDTFNDMDFESDAPGSRKGRSLAPPPTPGTPPAAAVRVGGAAGPTRASRRVAAQRTGKGTDKSAKPRRAPVRRLRWGSVAIAIVVLALLGLGLLWVAGLGGWGPLAEVAKGLANEADEAAAAAAAAAAASTTETTTSASWGMFAPQEPVPPPPPPPPPPPVNLTPRSRILRSYTSPTYEAAPVGVLGWGTKVVLRWEEAWGAGSSFFTRSVKTARGGFPENAIGQGSEEEKGKCWGMKGRNGHLTLSFSGRILPTNLTYTPPRLSPSSPTRLTLYALVPPFEQALALLRKPETTLAAHRGMFAQLTTLEIGGEGILDAQVDEDVFKTYEREAGGKGAEVLVVEIVREGGEDAGAGPFTCVRGIGVWGREVV